MEQNNLTLNGFEDIDELWIQRLILEEPSIIDKQLLTNVVKEDYALPDGKVDLKVDLKMSVCKNDMEKDAPLDIQMKPDEVLITEKDVQVSNQKSELDNFLILDLLKKLFKV